MNRIRSFFPIGVFLLLLIAIPLTMYLIRHPQIFKGRAHEVNISHIDFPGLSGDPPTTTSQNVILKLTYGTGSAPSPAPTTPPAATFKRVFVTSQPYNGNLGGLAGADQKCQSLANSASLGGTWKAWLSDARSSVSADAKTRMSLSNVEYRLVDNTTVVANNLVDLLDGSLQNPIRKNEVGQDIPDQSLAVWTHTKANGTSLGGLGNLSGTSSIACVNWQVSAECPSGGTVCAGHGGIGSAGATDSNWTNITSNLPGTDPPINGQFFPCNVPVRLYCFEQGSGSGQRSAGGATPTSTPRPNSGATGCTSPGGACGSLRCCGTADGYTANATCISNICTLPVSAPTPTTRPAATATPRPTSAPTAAPTSAPTAAPVVCGSRGGGCTPGVTTGYSHCCTGLTCKQVTTITTYVAYSCQ